MRHNQTQLYQGNPRIGLQLTNPFPGAFRELITYGPRREGKTEHLTIKINHSFLLGYISACLPSLLDVNVHIAFHNAFEHGGTSREFEKKLKFIYFKQNTPQPLSIRPWVSASRFSH
jgi:hypothetical protein